MNKQILFRDPGIKVEQVEHLTFHQVDLCQTKSKALEPLDRGVPRPVLVLGARVVEVLCRENQRGQEDSVYGASHPLGNGR